MTKTDTARMFEAARIWCLRKRWTRICDIENSDAMLLAWEELSPVARKPWRDHYGENAKSAWSEFASPPTRHRYGFVGSDGEFYAELSDVPRNMNSCMVFETGGKAGMYWQGGRGVRSASRR